MNGERFQMFYPVCLHLLAIPAWLTVLGCPLRPEVFSLSRFQPSIICASQGSNFSESSTLVGFSPLTREIVWLMAMIMLSDVLAPMLATAKRSCVHSDGNLDEGLHPVLVDGAL